MLGVGGFRDRPVIGKARHDGRVADPAIALLVRDGLPIGRETKAPIGPGKTIGETGFFVGPAAIDVAGLFHLFERRIVRACKGVRHHFTIGGAEDRIIAAQTQGDGVDDLVIGARLARRIDHGGSIEHAGVAATGVVIIVLEEHGGGQHDIGQFRRFGHELLVDHEEQVVAPQSLLHQGLVWRHAGRIGVLHNHGVHRRAPLQRLLVAGEDRANLGHVEQARRAFLQVLAGET